MPIQKTILVADDDPAVVALISTHCKQKGYRVLEALDGEQALTVSLQEQPDVIVLDVMMPGQTGWEVARSLQRSHLAKKPKILMLTGIGERLNATTAPLYGVDAYLDKPVGWSELEHTIGQLMDEEGHGG